eukprot:c12023_g1_i1.p1 GENE.c12023_g1_i1~~c12023_g1_i1.p1  ORF type:complete len:501 (+),score=178.61 c12023_g1_i1:60-1562(+)
MFTVHVPGTDLSNRVPGIDVFSLETWSKTTPSVNSDDLGHLSRESPFPFSEEVNAKVCLYRGVLYKLKVDAIVNSCNETLDDRTGLSGEIFEAAGGQLEDECSALEGCRTGEAKSTRAYNLPCQRIIHTAGPRFNAKYQTAAENALHSCYRQSLQLLTELNLRTIAFPSINSGKKGYPREAATHIALRTIRRFIEHHGDKLDLIVLCVDNEEDLNCYKKLLPLYMPRSKAEEQSVIDLLPAEIGNEHGEMVCEERAIRIKTLPGANFNAPVKITSESNDIKQVLKSSFGEMVEDQDTHRLATIQKSRSQIEIEEKEKEYARCLQRARSENFSDLEKMKLIHIGGVDEMGRTVVVFVAHHFPHSSEADYDRLLLFFFRELDPIVEKPFVVVYFHTKLESDRQPPLAWVKKSLSLLPRKYRAKLQNLYVVHPTMWMKMLLWVLTPFISQEFWTKLVYVEKLDGLYRAVPVQLLNMPQFVKDHDALLWGYSPNVKSEFREDGL